MKRKSSNNRLQFVSPDGNVQESYMQFTINSATQGKKNMLEFPSDDISKMMSMPYLPQTSSPSMSISDYQMGKRLNL